MRQHADPRAGDRKGFTLTELLVAVALASILMVALFQLLDTSLNLWGRGEVRRSVIELSSSTAELVTRDLRALHNGFDGDFLCEWVAFDLDGDGVADRSWQRMRIVRQASPKEMVRLGWPRAEEGLVEVVWAVLPVGRGKELASEGVLMRGEQIVPGADGTSFFAPGFFDRSGLPRVGALQEVVGGVLWFGPAFATQTSIVHDGWKIGYELADACASWDAWNQRRPDANQHEWNEPGAGMPRVEKHPLLPRRVRLELEFERPADRKRRTRTLELIEPNQTSFDVETGSLVPRAGEHILIGAEWMQVASKAGDRVYVKRGLRGTAPVLHKSGAMVHHGETLVVEVPIALYNDDWRL